MSDDVERERARYEALAALVDNYRRERDDAREQLYLTKAELGRWVDRETKAVRERDEWRDKFLALNQTAGELCNACGWAFRIPGEPCRCEVVKERDEARATLDLVEDQLEAAEAKLKSGEVEWAARRCECSAADACKMARERDEARAEVERLRAEADRWKRSCNVFRERDWPKAFQATVTSLEQEVSDAHEQLAKLRKLSKPWEGDAYRRGAEAMREACAQWIPYILHADCNPEEKMRAVPIPEEP